MSPSGRGRRGVDAAIEEFLASHRVAVVGASRHPEKFGHKVLAACLEHGIDADPMNPNESEILGRRCYASLQVLPGRAEAVSIVTPPDVTERIVEDAAEAGALRVWMQPGAESSRAIARARELGLDVLAGGPCILVALADRGGRRR